MSNASPGATGAQPHVVSQLRRSLGHRFGNPDDWTVEAIYHKDFAHTWRGVYCARETGSGRTFALKANSDRHRSRQQFEALVTLRSATQNCVSPLFLSNSAAYFAMEWVDAPLLRDVLLGPERGAALVRAGRWLKELHAATEGHPASESRLHPVSVGSAKVDDEMFRRAAGRLQSRMRKVAKGSGPIAMLHGDLHPGNIFDTGSQLLVFDRQAEQYGSAFFDIATFLLSLAKWGEADPARTDIDRRNFFEGYGPIDEEDLALCDLVEDLVFLQRCQSRAMRGRPLRDDQIRALGVLGRKRHVLRSGRLVKGPLGGVYWTKAPAPTGLSLYPLRAVRRARRLLR